MWITRDIYLRVTISLTNGEVSSPSIVECTCFLHPHQSDPMSVSRGRLGYAARAAEGDAAGDNDWNLKRSPVIWQLCSAASRATFLSRSDNAASAFHGVRTLEHARAHTHATPLPRCSQQRLLINKQTHVPRNYRTVSSADSTNANDGARRATSFF